jgi:hypothetical protein
MKFAYYILLLFLAGCQSPKEAPKAKPAPVQKLIPAPAPLIITGDFDGDGTQDTLRHFVTDSLGKAVDSIAELSDDDHPITLYDKYGYSGAITFNGKPADIMEGQDIFVYCLINLGDINATKGDEIALVPSNLDTSAMSHCGIYSYCNGSWKSVFGFGVTENAFDYDTSTPKVFTNIPQMLEKHNGQWIYLDYEEILNEDNPKMKPLKVADCK